MRAVVSRLCLVLASLLFAALLSEIGFRAYSQAYLREKLSLPDKPWPASNSKQIQLMGVGGSSIVGEPYDARFNLLSIVNYYLSRIYPAYEFSDIFAAEKGYSLHELLPLVEEGFQSRPDLMLVFAGHNEFLSQYPTNGRCGRVEDRLYQVFRKSALFRFFYRRFKQQRVGDKPRSDKRGLFDVSVACADDWDDTLGTFSEHVSELARAAHVLKVPAVFVFPPGIETGLNPNRSVYRGSEVGQNEFQKHFACGRAVERFDLTEASAHYSEALLIDARHAELNYRIGEVLRELGKGSQAKDYLSRALENDAFPWRAVGRQREALENAASRYGHVFIDGKREFEALCPDGLLGVGVFHDLHHPSVAGYHALAKRIVREIQKSDLLGLGVGAEVDFLSEQELLMKFGFTRSDWLSLFYSRYEWLRRVAEVSFDSSDRLRLSLDYIDALRAVDAEVFKLLVRRPASLNRLREDIRRQTAEWERLCEAAGGDLQAAKERKLRRENSACSEGNAETLPLSCFYLPGQAGRLQGFVELAQSAPYRKRHEISISGVPASLYLTPFPTEEGMGFQRRLRFRGKVYKRGFGLHPPDDNDFTAISSFWLQGRYQHFTASLGIADSGREMSSAICRIVADGKEVFSSPVLGRKDAPVRVNVSVKGVDRLYLVCDNADDGSEFDHVVWVEPKLV